MVNSEIKRIAESIWSSEESVIQIDEYIEACLEESYPTANSLQIGEKLERSLPAIISELSRKISICTEQGTTPLFDFDKLDKNKLIRADLRKKEDPRASRLVVYHKEVEKVINQMNWRDFEHLCKFLLNQAGFTHCEVGQGSKEGGIDFHGLIDLNKLLDGRNIIARDVIIRVVGQAKRLGKDKKVSEKNMDEFVTKFYKIKKKYGAGWNKLPDWFKDSNAPMIAFYITNIGYSKGAMDTAAEENIILKSGDQIVEEIISSSQWNEWITIIGGKNIFDIQKFNNYLRRC